MPAPLITTDGQFQIGDVLIGTDLIRLVSVDGLGTPAPKTRDVDLDLSDGVVFGADLQASRSVALTVDAVSSPAAADRQADAMTRARGVLAVWPVSSATTTLYGRMPGWGKIAFSGRTRGADVDLSDLLAGLVHLHLVFICPDSTMGVW